MCSLMSLHLLLCVANLTRNDLMIYKKASLVSLFSLSQKDTRPQRHGFMFGGVFCFAFHARRRQRKGCVVVVGLI